MKTFKIISLCTALIFCSLSVFGCRKKADESEKAQETAKVEEIKKVAQALKADVTTAINEIKAEVGKLNVQQLRETALQYQQLIQSKTSELDKINNQLKEMDLTKALGDEAKDLRAEFENITKSISALKERFRIYYDKLKEKGGDLTGLTP
jgi:uncharacterized coiled-coil DUF342 family protein